jgi:tetratricopeptide (TPR) repeat protein
LIDFSILRAGIYLFLERKYPAPILSFIFPFLLGSVQGKAQALMLTGKALNVTPDYSPKAEELLSKAVKLEPELVEAWNQLGEVYWKKGDVAAAHTCFSGALTHVSCPLYPWSIQIGRKIPFFG